MEQYRSLPRITYSNVHQDFSGVYDLLDGVIAKLSAVPSRVYPNIINGQEDRDGSHYEVVSPIDKNIKLGEFTDASEAAVQRAVAAARTAQPDWAGRRWEERVSILRRLATEMESRKY